MADRSAIHPVVISTWKHGLAANRAAWKILGDGGSALDAVEHGVRVSEADPSVVNVGYGGLPDASCRVTLDAAIMGPDGRVGAVGFLEHIQHPVSVARRVMEKTEHVMLMGEGALEFALREGFAKTDLLTPSARQRWSEWRSSGGDDEARLGINEQGHDTIGMLALDRSGNCAAACSTSGVGWKLRGRVGDSPIPGAGLYVDSAIGAAVGTGRGELIMQVCGSHLVVELMRNGSSPQEACERAVERILALRERGSVPKPESRTFQAGFIAVNTRGQWGAASIRPGFSIAVQDSDSAILVESRFLLAEQINA